MLPLWLDINFSPYTAFTIRTRFHRDVGNLNRLGYLRCSDTDSLQVPRVLSGLGSKSSQESTLVRYKYPSKDKGRVDSTTSLPVRYAYAYQLTVFGDPSFQRCVKAFRECCGRSKRTRSPISSIYVVMILWQVC